MSVDSSAFDQGQQAAFDAFGAALVSDDPEQLYDRAPCGYLTTTPDGILVKVNETFLLQTGYQRAELIGRRRFIDVLSVGGRIFHETHYAPLLRMHGAAREIAFEVVRADGSRLPVLVNSVLERDATGAAVVIRIAVFDATQRRDYERELLRAKQRAEESEARAKVLAHTLQQTLIPPAHPRIPGLDVAALYRPAGDGTEVGGDFYDVFEIGPDDWCAVIGDVCGKGVDAAVVTALARYTLRAAAVRQPLPSAALRTLNDVMLHHDTDRFCTVSALRLRRHHDVWTATISSAGHPLPTLVHRGGAPIALGRPGTLAGVFDRVTFSDTTVRLGPGDIIVLYTDGVTEGRDATGTFYGEERLIAALSEDRDRLLGLEAAEAITKRLLDDVLAFQSGNPRDDIAIVAIAVPIGRVRAAEV